MIARSLSHCLLFRGRLFLEQRQFCFAMDRCFIFTSLNPGTLKTISIKKVAMFHLLIGEGLSNLARGRSFAGLVRCSSSRLDGTVRSVLFGCKRRIPVQFRRFT